MDMYLNIIATEEYERFLDELSNNEITECTEYASYDDFEDEYGHNEIDEAQHQLEEVFNDYLNEHNIDMIAFESCECVRVWTKENYNRRIHKNFID